MDRYVSHTIHCRSCSTALIWIRRAQPVCWGLLWLGAILIGINGGLGLISIGLIVSAGGALGLRQTKRWERGLLVGDGQAPRNQPSRP
jgi:hypothetical protein